MAQSSAESPSASATPQPQLPDKKIEQPKAERGQQLTDPVAKPDLKVTAAPVSGSHVEGESFVIALTIANNGQGVAKEAKGSVDTVSGAQFTALDWADLGAPLAPKATRPLLVTVRFAEATAAEGVLKVALELDDATPADNTVEVKVTIVPPTTKGAVGGTVYTDKDGDKKLGAGEGAADVTVTVNGPRVKDRTAKTDANGQFKISDLPAGWYTVKLPPQLTGGWVTTETSVAVKNTADSEKLELRADRPLSEGLLASAKFNGGPYEVGDTAKLSISLTNNGSTHLTGLVVVCELEQVAHLRGTTDPANWDDLATNGPGMALKPGEARTLPVQGTVPESSKNEGVVYIYCDIRSKTGSQVTGNPSLFVLAKVPGRNGVGNGWFFNDENKNDKWTDDEPRVASLPVTLLDPLSGKVVASTTTGADGGYRFADIPAGWYIPVFDGPWKLKNNDFLVVSADEDRGKNELIPLLRGLHGNIGDANKPPLKPPASNSTTQNQSQNRALANTGANVIGLTIGGVVVLLLGVGAVLFTRRRRRG
nr:SdrD B-like domain-containing protein [Kibdelosporangium sp. MJ126-NF4]CEL14806.1 hypothetical protein [Kibdelosporangium sp. MJ126-NF4]